MRPLLGMAFKGELSTHRLAEPLCEGEGKAAVWGRFGGVITREDLGGLFGRKSGTGVAQRKAQPIGGLGQGFDPEDDFSLCGPPNGGLE